ncbi:MAG: hypothetical protein A3C70_02350 [Candidatus Zambryskibacteria bacterium RIFCSPHIGHO2_02_FULL_43_14]|uniref:Type II toxin-antitoxin system mRNA interferase toxin, RelE/StbE family n=1 Tax=Candidatus Zambryskibacteria bacterium RIFCSPHIGHO2_02_FULL_43_14 TaxID=1802748 RepID=A0A1G2TJZ3_9BACT|nr:MAG: hypothetical protein A2829_00040 [Candidatus Zambryskibacteria bacterium RIFCSPHIGHO2_01_FULL_43_60]OHA96999.1 MAG: hypothetical protein A3C70_02350 [Candidatus Zambryskibacteria bacterium RIFCSPHIGHO2_02_FULL_43_14]OHB03724.1 MAG: hypothetical protein A3B03_01905 [Candidatus Zambryskibacteria bacterium RIFCSPLOWO2_01_FULL_42_41]
MIVTTTRKFDKKFRKQSIQIKTAFKNRVEIFLKNSDDPILKIHRLSGKLRDLWSFNVTGDVRVVFDRSRREIAIFVDIGTHSELYS